MYDKKPTDQQTVFDEDIAIIGGGPGGYAAALHAAKLGATVTLIEKDRLGGTCLNRGCVPTKYLAQNAEFILKVKKVKDLNEFTGDLTINFQQVMTHMNDIVRQLELSIEQLLRTNKVRILNGNARLISPHVVEVNDIMVHAKNVIIATGSKPFMLPIAGAGSNSVLSTDQILKLRDIPHSVAVVGGNYVGLEFAIILNALGAKVTVIEKRPSLLQPVIDEEVSRRFLRSLLKQSVDVVTNADVTEIKQDKILTKVIFESSGCQKECAAQVVLMATGRQPCTDGLGLEEIGINMDGRAVSVNKLLQTNISNVFAIGDVIGKNMLAHVASYEGEIAVDNALGRIHEVDYRVVPSCVFVTPEIACVGITETMAKENGISYRVSKLPLTASSRAVITGEASGIIKMICNSGNGAVIGLHIMGSHASDLVAEGALAMKLGATAEDIAQVIHAHPTFSEALREAALRQAVN